MAKLSPKRESVPLLAGLVLLARGKVRDSYLLPDGKHILQVATDGISIFDFVLNALVPMKGVILTALSVFWFKKLEEYGVRTHLVAYGAAIDEYLPAELRGNPDLQSRALVVKKLEMANVEFVVRSCLTGSALKPYRVTGMVCGHQIVSGLEDGDVLPCLLDTPTTKAEVGHDEHMNAAEIRARYPDQTYTALKVFQIAETYARSCGIVLADTKFEFAADGTLADEVLTPDASRYWSLPEWLRTRAKDGARKAPTAYDKEFVRGFGIKHGINLLKPENPDDVATAQALEIPNAVIKKTTDIYRYIFWRLTGESIEDYLRLRMGVNAKRWPVAKVAIVCGSESDLPAVQEAVRGILPQDAEIVVHVMSCHRNPKEVAAFAANGCGGAEAVIAVGGKALALPGIVDAHAHALGFDIPVIGVALGEPGSDALLAAQLSIEELPGAPVIIDEFVERAYEGADGLRDALDRIISGELPPSSMRTEKPVQMRVWSNNPTQ